jgi:hypothetical protein
MTGDTKRGVREPFRPLTERERKILDFLLAVEGSGMGDLRSQVPYASAARWDCGCASFEIEVDRKRAPRSTITTSPAIEATTLEREDSSKTFDVLLWVDDGWLSGVEIVDYVDQHGDESPDEIPPPEAWNEPRPR